MFTTKGTKDTKENNRFVVGERRWASWCFVPFVLKGRSSTTNETNR
jgi:hypothetical protein